MNPKLVQWGTSSDSRKKNRLASGQDQIVQTGNYCYSSIRAASIDEEKNCQRKITMILIQNVLSNHITLHITWTHTHTHTHTYIYIYIYIYIIIYYHFSGEICRLPHILKCNSSYQEWSTPGSQYRIYKRIYIKENSFTYAENNGSAGFRSLIETKELWYN